MASVFTKEEVEILCRDLWNIAPITKDYPMICGCCGAIKSKGHQRRVAEHSDNRIFISEINQNDPIPSPSEGFDSFLLPDKELNVLIEWHTQCDLDGRLKPCCIP